MYTLDVSVSVFQIRTSRKGETKCRRSLGIMCDGTDSIARYLHTPKEASSEHVLYS